MKRCLYAVQDEHGREVVAWSGAVDKVAEVTAVAGERGRVELRRGDEVLATGDAPGHGGALTLHRWPAKDKLTDPVSHPVDRA